MKKIFTQLIRDESGAMAIETAIVAPTLIIMSLGVVEIGTIVARQHELQTAANEATIMVMAANQGPEIEVSTMREIIRTSVGLTDEQITMEKEFRCATAGGKVKLKGSCPTSGSISEYVAISITDTYTPRWTSFGFGDPIRFSVNRSVQVS